MVVTKKNVIFWDLIYKWICIRLADFDQPSVLPQKIFPVLDQVACSGSG
jgi:hypothetical protein